MAVINTTSTLGNTVAADHWQGGQLIGAYPADLGHQRFLIIGSNPESNVQNDRADGIRSALLKDATCETLWIEKLERDARSGCLLGLAWTVEQGFSAFAALSDLQALRALTELHREGIDVPAAVSVTGFDDLIWSPVITPALTTVKMDMDKDCRNRLGRLARQHQDKQHPGGKTRHGEGRPCPKHLLIRQSSGPRSPLSNLEREKTGQFRQTL